MRGRLAAGRQRSPADSHDACHNRPSDKDVYAKPRVTMVLEDGMQVRARVRVLWRAKVTCRSDPGMRDSAGRACVHYASHFDSAVAKSIKPLGSPQQCTDLKGDRSGGLWTDGERFCIDFERLPPLCNTFGLLDPLGQGTAVDKCCGCGGGVRTGLGPFVGVTPGPMTLAQRLLDEALPADSALLAQLESCQAALNSTAGGDEAGAAIHEKCCECGGGTRLHPVTDVEVPLARVNQVAPRRFLPRACQRGRR
jgi:hypothetical protein